MDQDDQEPRIRRKKTSIIKPIGPKGSCSDQAITVTHEIIAQQNGV